MLMLVMYHVLNVCQVKRQTFFEIMLRSPANGCLSKCIGLDMLGGSTKTSSPVHMLYRRQDLGILSSRQTTHISQDPQPLGQQPLILSLFAYNLQVSFAANSVVTQVI